jgi:hypothetical protein
MIVPGGGISIDRSRWIAKRPDFFLPVRVLSKLFRRLMIEKCQTAFNFGSDSLSMKFAVGVALIWRENQRHASTTADLLTGAQRLRRGDGGP